MNWLKFFTVLFFFIALGKNGMVIGYAALEGVRCCVCHKEFGCPEDSSEWASLSHFNNNVLRMCVHAKCCISQIPDDVRFNTDALCQISIREAFCQMHTGVIKASEARFGLLDEIRALKHQNREAQLQLRQERTAQAELEQERTKSQTLIAEKAVLARELEVAERTRLMMLGCAVGVTAAVVGAIAYLYGKQQCHCVLSK